jgi:predicted 3-demethylubiquinone-9 3-methyltransferase (glyoxalase superfamily)
MQSIDPCLWFDNQAEEAAKFYTSIFPNSRIIRTAYYSENMPLPAGTVLTVSFEIQGQRYLALNGGPQFKFSEAVSLMVRCEDQAELDSYWAKLLAGGGQESQCGWLKDKFGFSWQVAPANVDELVGGGTPEQSARVMAAVMKMVKLDIAAMEAAFHGTAGAAQ